MKVLQKPRAVDDILKQDAGKIVALLDKPEVQKLISTLNKEYVHWDKLRHMELPEEPEPIWALLKMFRRNQAKKVRFNGWTLQFMLTDASQRMLHLLDKNAAGNLEAGFGSVPTGSKERYILSSLMEEAIASSQLEGAATTRLVAKQMLRLNRRPTSYSEQMIVNGYRTMQRIVKMKDKAITPETLLELHKEITLDTLNDKYDEGRFRDNNEVVVGDPLKAGNIYHRPPDFHEVPGLMKEFCDFASDDSGDFIHPVVKGILLHFLLGYIHPFNDGNGRTARSIFYWYVLTRGYWLFEYMAMSRVLLRSKKEYGLAYLYTETDDNDLTYFINYNLHAIEGALDDMQAYIARKQKEQAEALQLISSLRDINLRQAEILKEFIKQPDKAFVLGEIMGMYHVAYATARSDLLHLAGLGYVQQIRLQKKFIFRLGKLPPG